MVFRLRKKASGEPCFGEETKHPFAFQVAHFYVSVDIRLGIKRHLVRGGCRIGGVIPETRIEVWKERWREKSI